MRTQVASSGWSGCLPYPAVVRVIKLLRKKHASALRIASGYSSASHGSGQTLARIQADAQARPIQTPRRYRFWCKMAVGFGVL